MICVTDWVENTVGKGENAVYRHFLLFPQCFQKASFPGLLKVVELITQIKNTFENILFMPPYQNIGGILFYHCLSVCLSVCTNLTWKFNIFPLPLN